MARLLMRSVTLALFLGLTSIALAQQQQPNQPPTLGPVLSNPDVQKELKLTDEQIRKLKEAFGKVGEKYKEDFAKFRTMSQEERVKKMMEFSKDNNKAMAGILDAKQLKRYRQIDWQIAGIGALGDPILQKELKLSDEQKKKLNDIFLDVEKKMEEMSKNPGASREEFQKKLAAFVKDVESKANAVLTDDQKKSFKELKGPKFEFSRPAPPPQPKKE